MVCVTSDSKIPLYLTRYIDTITTDLHIIVKSFKYKNVWKSVIKLCKSVILKSVEIGYKTV